MMLDSNDNLPFLIVYDKPIAYSGGSFCKIRLIVHLTSCGQNITIAESLMNSTYARTET